MFWFSEKVGADLAKSAVECLAANNPSYKGYNAMAYGAGEHELEFKNGKFVTYTFTGAEDGGCLEFKEVIGETPNKNKNKNKNK